MEPLGPLNELLGIPRCLFFVSSDSEENVDIVSSESRDRWSVAIVAVRRAIFLLWSFAGGEVVDAFEAVVPLDAVLQFKLEFGHGRIKLDCRLIDGLRGLAVVSPSEQHFVALVLEAVLPSFEELAEFIFDFGGI